MASLAGQIAEAKAWVRRSHAGASRAAIAEAVRLYIVVRWELLDDKNRAWMLDKIMEDFTDAPAE